MFTRFINRTLKNSAAYMSGASTMRARLVPVIGFIGLIWLAFLGSYLLPLNQHFGLIPRSLGGLSGVVFMPFLHANVGHIMSNTMALAVLLCLLVVSRPKAWAIIFVLTVVSGLSLWILGRSANHIGASGLIYALMGFLLAAGIFERRPLSMLMAVIVGVTYGSVIISGIVPGSESVSWEGHLVGLLAGCIVAWLQFRKPAR